MVDKDEKLCSRGSSEVISSIFDRSLGTHFHDEFFLQITKVIEDFCKKGAINLY